MTRRTNEFFSQLIDAGWRLHEPRPRFPEALEAALEGEMEQETSGGEESPHAVADLPSSVQLLQRQQEQRLLYVVPSALRDGFWGVNAAAIEELTAQPLAWALVLLDRGKIDHGYWLSGAEAANRAGHDWQRIVPEGAHFEVRPAHLHAVTRFENSNDLQRLVDGQTGA